MLNDLGKYLLKLKMKNKQGYLDEIMKLEQFYKRKKLAFLFNVIPIFVVVILKSVLDVVKFTLENLVEFPILTMYHIFRIILKDLFVKEELDGKEPR